MPGYITKALHNFQHSTPKQPQHVLHDWTVLAYGSRFQCAQIEPDLLIQDPVDTQQG